jgi:hypothetical protein
VGIQLAFSSALSGLASYFGAQLMGIGDYRTPFFLMAGFILVANVIFWQFFGKQEQAFSPAPRLGGAEVAG